MENKVKLVKPSSEYKDSFLKAEREFQVEGKSRHVNPNITNIQETEKNFEKFLVEFENEEKGVNLKEGYVPATTLWLVDNGEFIGSVSIRHKLTEKLLKEGGHIGYSIRPSKRKMGYGTQILKLVLPVAKKFGIYKVLVTCNDDNIGSAKIIEKNGGILENKMQCGDNLKRRYWINNAKI